jgi:hypothetical protein
VSFGLALLLFLQVASDDEASAYIAEAGKTLNATRRCDPAADPDEVVVCGRRIPAERYRLPIRPDRFDPKGPIDSVSRERHKLIQEGDAGIGSCSTIGPGGSSGCFHRSTKRRCEQEICGFAF